MKTFLRHSFFSSLPKKTNQKRYFRTSIFALLICVLFLHGSIIAQQYHTYHNADSANPILNATPIPQGITNMQFFDVDGDGDQDCYMMLTGNKLVLYLNVGTVTRPEYKQADYTGLEDVTLVSTQTRSYANLQHFYFFDMDNDGDKDLFIEGYYLDPNRNTNDHAFIQTYLNDGSPQKPHFTTTYVNPISISTSSPIRYYYYFTFQDIDGDGDLDFAYSLEASSFQTGIYLNTSTSGNATFVQYGYGSEITTLQQSFYDFSGDGLPDCILESGGFYPNIGTPTSPRVDLFRFGGIPPSPTFNVAPVTIVDLNNDGQVETFDRTGHYATVVPVPVLKASTANVSGKPVTKLTATTQLPGYKYQWEYNGKKVVGYNKPFIYAPQKGKYVLYITDSLGTGVSLPYIIAPATNNASANEKLIVKTSPATQALSVNVYPSPFRQNITINMSGGNAATRTIRISDMAGKIWLTQTTAASSVQAGSALPKGMYQLEVWENNTLAYHTKILKQ